MEIVCVGEVMVEVSRGADGSARLGFGGDTFNTAVYLARLGQSVGYLTALGDDPWSNLAREALRDEGVEAGFCPTAEGETMGLYAIQTDAAGERSFTYWRQNAPARGLFGPHFSPAVRDTMLNARLVYLTGISLWLYDDEARKRLFETVSACRSRGGLVAFDGNYRPRLWGPDRSHARDVYRQMLDQTDICLATFDDEADLWGDISPGASLDRLTQIGVREVVIKCGPKGAIITSGDIIETRPDPAPVDTTAAGDSFNAAYLAARLAQHSQADAARAGNRLAARVIQHPGALLPKGPLWSTDPKSEF